MTWSDVFQIKKHSWHHYSNWKSWSFIKKLIMRFNALKLLVVNIAALFDKLINLQVIFLWMVRIMWNSFPFTYTVFFICKIYWNYRYSSCVSWLSISFFLLSFTEKMSAVVQKLCMVMPEERKSLWRSIG